MGARLHRRGNGAAARTARRPAAARSPCPARGVVPAHRLVQARRRPRGHDGPDDHAQRRPHHPATAVAVAAPPPPHRLRSGHRSAAVSGTDDPRPDPTAQAADRRARPSPGQTVERVRRPLPRSGMQALVVGAQMRCAVHDKNGWPLTRRLQGLRLDPCRNHPETRALRHPQAIRQTQKDIWLRPLAPAPRQTLTTHPQPVNPAPQPRHH